MSNTTADRFEFLVKITADYFLSEIDGRTITGSSVPRVAAHFDYRAADRICSGLRVHGYPQCCVTDSLGRPVTADMLLTPPAELPVPSTVAEADKISGFERKRRMKTDKKFAERITQLYSDGAP